MASVVDFKPQTGRDIPLPAKQTPAFKLFHWYYQCLVPANATYDDNDLEYFGIPTTGDQDWDAALSSANTDRAFTAADMATMVTYGSPLSLLDPRDAVPIYLTIFEHLCDWRDALNNHLINRPIPVEGLVEFNTLGRLMITIARRYGYQDGIKAKVVNSGRWLAKGPDPVSPLGKIMHNEKLLSEILTLAQSRGQDVSKYAMSIKAETPSNIKIGSMWSNRRT